MSGELDLIRGFRAEDAVVDASSQEMARAALLEHIAGSTNSTPRKRWGWLRGRSRPMVVLLAALVIAGSAAAAVFSLGSASQPLVGKVPGAITPASLAGYRYTIMVIPGLGAGGPGGWQSFIVYSRRGITSHEFSPVAGSPTATNPIFTFSGFGDTDLEGRVFGESLAARGKTVAYVVTGPQVLAVRIGSRTIRTASSPTLPAGDRAAVFFIPAKGAFPIPGWRPGLPVRGYLRGTHLPFIAMLPLDRSGRVIASAPPFTGPPSPGSFPLTWMAANAVTRWWPLPGFTVPYHHSGYHGRTHPGPGVCELAQQGLPALHAEFGHTVATISPDHEALGQVFVSCIDSEYYLHGWPLQAGVLLDGHRPGQVLGPIPGARPVPGQPDMVNLPAGRVPWNYGSPVTADSPQFSLTAKRVGDAWLVVQGGSGLAQRVQVLGALRISKLDLHHVASRGASH